MVSDAGNEALNAVRAAFDDAFYGAENPDVVQSGLAPYDHFMTYGWREGRDPVPWFSIDRYLALNPDVAAAGVNPFVHHVLYGRSEGRPTQAEAGLSRKTDLDPDLETAVEALFDAAWYARTNPDVSAVGLEPFQHFMQAGWREKRDPAPWFSIPAYLEANPDVAAAGGNPFVHYVQLGRDEDRSLGSRPLARNGMPAAAGAGHDPLREAFDPAFYRASNPQLDLGETDPFDHFMHSGWREGRDPNADFSVAKYLQLNPDVEVADANPFWHYILYGRAEGRPTAHGFDFRNDILRNTPPFEGHLQDLRRGSPEPPADPVGAFEAILSDPGRTGRLHITVSQDDYTSQFGGIQLCLRLESQAVRAAGSDHIHLFPVAVGMVVEIERDHPPVGVLLNGKFIGLFAPAAMIEALDDVPTGGPVSLAVHSLIGHTVPDLIRILQGFGVRDGIYWVHDYSSLCAGYTLMRNDVTFCGAPPADSAACGVCSYRPRRRIQVAEHARLFDCFRMGVIAPSDTALSLWKRSFPRTPAWSIAHPHATLIPQQERPAQEVGDGPLRVAFLGMPTHHKGWPVFAALVDAFRFDPRYEFHHLARRPAPGLPVQFSEVNPTDANPEPMSGVVSRLRLDVAVIWSLWPETFCFTAFEAVAGGALVLTNPAAGNVTAFARDPARGRVVESDAALFDLFRSGELVSLVRQTVRAGPGRLSYTGMSADFVGHQAP
jgi:hypothetical protein